MHNKIKSTIQRVLEENEITIKGMEPDFFAMMLTVELTKELQAKEVPAPRPPKAKKEEKTGEKISTPNTPGSSNLQAMASK